MPARRNVLIFHLGALGDFILTWPVALALARLHPQSRIFYVTHGDKGRLAEQVLHIESADIEAGWHALFSEGAALPTASEKLLSSAHTVVSFLSNGRDAWAANVRRIAGDVNLIALNGPTLASPPVAEHAAWHIAKQLQPWPALSGAVEQILRSIGGRGVGGTIAPMEMVVIHPGSGAAKKCWPLDRFVELARRLQADGRTVRFVVGEAEVDRWPQEALRALGEGAPVERLKNSIELWRLINGASAFVGNDSGPAHLAGMLAVPTVVLYGPTKPEIWKPLGPKVMAISAESLDAISVEQVFAAIPEQK
jgi:ADP-heptose:LPS heptosyltransferase